MYPTQINNKNKIQLTLTVAILLFACLLIAGTATAQTSGPMQPPEGFNGTRPDFGGNMTFPDDFNRSSGFPDGGSGFNGTRPDFNGNMPGASGVPESMNGPNQTNTTQTTGFQIDYTLVLAIAAAVIVAVIAVLAVVLHKRKVGTSES